MNDETPQKDRLGHLGKARNKRVFNPAYSRFVRIMRFVLPVSALAIMVVVIAWPRMEASIVPLKTSMEPVEIEQLVSRNELINPRFESEDDRSQPYTITATRAIQSIENADAVLLEEPKADITLRSGTWVAIEANQGTYRQNAQNLLLEGDVRLYHDEGYRMHTPRMMMNLPSRHARSDERVTGQGPGGSIEASGFQLHAESETLIFTGPATLVINRSVKGL